MKYFKISEGLLNKILGNLGVQQYANVAQLIQELQSSVEPIEPVSEKKNEKPIK